MSGPGEPARTSIFTEPGSTALRLLRDIGSRYGPLAAIVGTETPVQDPEAPVSRAFISGVIPPDMTLLGLMAPPPLRASDALPAIRAACAILGVDFATGGTGLGVPAQPYASPPELVGAATSAKHGVHESEYARPTIVPALAVGNSPRNGLAADGLLEMSRPDVIQGSATSEAERAPEALPLDFQAVRSDSDRAREHAELRAVRELDALALGIETEPAISSTAGTIIASFILNAAMIPGWPQPRLRDDLEDKLQEIHELVEQHAPVSDEEMIMYLANFGLNENLIARLRAASAKPEGFQRSLTFLARLMKAFAHVLDSLRKELVMIADDLAGLEGAQDRGSGDFDAPPGSRLRLFIK